MAETFSTSSLKPPNGIQLNLTGSKILTSPTKCVFFGPIVKTRWPPRPLIYWDIFDFFSATAVRNSTKFDRKQDLKRPLPSLYFFDRSEKQDDVLASDWLLLWNRLTEFNETWLEARSQRPLPSLCFSRPIRKQDGRPGLPIKKVTHCTQVHYLWPFAWKTMWTFLRANVSPGYAVEMSAHLLVRWNDSRSRTRRSGKDDLVLEWPKLTLFDKKKIPTRVDSQPPHHTKSANAVRADAADWDIELYTPPPPLGLVDWIIQSLLLPVTDITLLKRCTAQILLSCRYALLSVSCPSKFGYVTRLRIVLTTASQECVRFRREFTCLPTI